MKLMIRNCRVIDPASSLDEVMDLEITSGVISRMGRDLSVLGEPDRSIDGTGLTAAPGLVDPHVHFRDPGYTYKEDIFSGAKAAARGGYTTVVMMANTNPVTDSAAQLDQVLAKGRQTGIHVLSAASVTLGMKGTQLTDFKALRQHGAVCLSDDGLPLSSGIAWQAMQQARQAGLPISLHEEDGALIGVHGINEGDVSAALHFVGAPAAAEEILVARDCVMAGHLGTHIHIQHLSSAGTVRLIAQAKADHVPVTCEATPQHFSLTQDAVLSKGSLAKVNPPLRTEADRQAIIKGLCDGTIDMIATDHAPHSREEKELPLCKAPSGMIGLETALSLGITNLVRPGILPLSRLLALMSIQPARAFGLSAGTLREGGPADLVLFDAEKEYTVDHFASRSANSPFLGQQLTGLVRLTICRGQIVYENIAEG